MLPPEILYDNKATSFVGFWFNVHISKNHLLVHKVAFMAFELRPTMTQQAPLLDSWITLCYNLQVYQLGNGGFIQLLPDC